MTRRLLVFLSPGLFLISCDKPASTDAHEDAAIPAATRRGHAPRKETPGTPAALRTILEEAIKLEPSTDREKMLADVAWNALEIDPALAHEAFLKLPADSPEKIRLIQHYAMRLAEENPDEALAWAETLGTELEIAAAKSLIAVAISETDPQRAANLLSESGLAGRDLDVAVVQVVQRWAAQSPTDAGAWVSSFPPGAARAAGVRVIAEQWLPRDARAAFDWLGGMKDAVIRKETARAMEGIILQQPKDIRDAWLQHADATIQNELNQQLVPATEDVGDNIPPGE